VAIEDIKIIGTYVTVNFVNYYWNVADKSLWGRRRRLV